jgi:hypothetical protein
VFLLSAIETDKTDPSAKPSEGNAPQKQRRILRLSMSYLGEHKDYLIEASQRRNLLVHNSGTVNRIYLSNYPKTLDTPPTIGDKLDTSSEYLSDTISRFERCFLLIALELWKKVDKDDVERGKFTINLAYNHLLAEMYKVAESLSLFGKNDNTLQENDRLYSQINYWQARKYGEEFDEIKKDIEKEDFSAKDKLFVLAQNALLDKYDETSKDIEHLLNHNDDDCTF